MTRGRPGGQTVFVGKVAIRLAATILVATATARGEIALRVNCPALDDESAAVLEARARAQTMTLPGAGTVVIECGADAARVVWQPASGERRETSVRVAGPREDVVDAILAAIDTSPSEEWLSSPSPPPEATRPARAQQEDSTTDVVVSPSKGVGIHDGFAPFVGAGSELWSSGIDGAVGLRGGARLRLAPRWSASLLGEYTRGTNEVSGLRASTLRIAGLAEYAPIPFLRLGAGACVRVLRVDARGGSRSSKESGTLCGVVAVHGVGRVGRFEVAAGPALELLVFPQTAELTGREVFRVPRLLPTLGVDASIWF
jgi:hypothetical protein